MHCHDALHAAGERNQEQMQPPWLIYGAILGLPKTGLLARVGDGKRDSEETDFETDFEIVFAGADSFAGGEDWAAAKLGMANGESVASGLTSIISDAKCHPVLSSTCSSSFGSSGFDLFV
ncbi:hypothetical protein FOMPIDRAFT_1052986 [Fomitopsis schrenkii]|uniref:Uncharacterized protein n=1 Tax=Fomitopsis schrenkii TaxID=2126942 RepID=S8F4Z8_FOMSC|nr:hypothetical protein FOMPIDRAFT_1052986 [Fomitopsis schrenkii]